MGSCASNTISEQPLIFTAQDQEKAYRTIFSTVVKMAVQMLDLEIITRQALSPPSDEVLLGLCAVAVIDIAAAQLHNPRGIVIVPGSGETVTKSNCPAFLKQVVEPLIAMKDELAKISISGELHTGDVNRMKQFVLFGYTETPMKIWGSSLQKYEAVTDYARQAADATKALPAYTEHSAAAATEIQAAIQNRVVGEGSPKAGSRRHDTTELQDIEDEEDDAPIIPLHRQLPDRGRLEAGHPPSHGNIIISAGATHTVVVEQELEDVEDL